MTRIIVDNYENGVCDLRDEETGRRFRARCEPTGRTKKQEDQKAEEVLMQIENYENAGQRLDAKIRRYCAERHCDYADGLKAMKQAEPELWHRYASDESDPDREVRRGSEEFGRRVKAYSEEWNLTKDEAEKRVRAHDPNMRSYSTDRGGVNMNTEKVSLSAESVVDVRAQERMKQGAKNYSEAMRAVLADDPLLAECYRAGKPYLEASAHSYHSYQAEMPNVSAKQQLGVLINGARLASNAPDVELMLKIANLTPDLVRGAASERLDELANALTGKAGMPQQRADAYPEALSQVRSEHPALVAASESGRLSEEALREIFYMWFTERD